MDEKTTKPLRTEVYDNTIHNLNHINGFSKEKQYDILDEVGTTPEYDLDKDTWTFRARQTIKYFVENDQGNQQWLDSMYFYPKSKLQNHTEYKPPENTKSNWPRGNTNIRELYAEKMQTKEWINSREKAWLHCETQKHGWVCKGIGNGWITTKEDKNRKELIILGSHLQATLNKINKIIIDS